MLSRIRQRTSAYATYAYVCLRMLSQVVATVRRRPQDLQDFCIPRIASQAVCALKLLVYAALSYSVRGLKIQGRFPLIPFEL